MRNSFYNINFNYTSHIRLKKRHLQSLKAAPYKGQPFLFHINKSVIKKRVAWGHPKIMINIAHVFEGTAVLCCGFIRKVSKFSYFFTYFHLNIYTTDSQQCIVIFGIPTLPLERR